MTDWPVKTLGEVCEILDSLRKPITKRDRTSGVYPYYGATGIVDHVADYIFDERLVLVGEDGAKWDAGDRTAFIVEGKYWVNNHAHVLRCKTGVLVDSWLANYLTMSDLNKYVSGLTVPKLNQGSLVSIAIPVPPLEEQKRIVELLDAATARVSELSVCYEQARTHASNLFTRALRDELEGNPDWPVKTLGEVATFHNGRTYKQQELLNKGKYRVLRVGNFFSSKGWYWSDLELDEHKYCDKGDLLYAWSASFGPRIWDEEKVIYHYHIWKVVEDSQQIDRQFLKYWLEEDVERVKSTSGTGTTMMHVSKGSIEARSICLPPLEEQKRIVARLDSMRAKTSEMVAAYDAKLQAAKNLRQSILEAAFAGQLC